MRLFSNTKDKWFTILLRWEVLRIIYNFIMIIAGIASINIANVTIPIVYMAIGLLFNIIFTFLWIIDLFLIRYNRRSKSKSIFVYYTLLSILLVFSFSFWILRQLTN